MEKLFEDERDKEENYFDQLKGCPLQQTLGKLQITWQYLGSKYIGLMIFGDFMNKCSPLRSRVYHIKG